MGDGMSWKSDSWVYLWLDDGADGSCKDEHIFIPQNPWRNLMLSTRQVSADDKSIFYFLFF